MASRRKAKAKPKKYRVRAELDNFELVKAKSALRLQIYSRGKKVGELEVGRGSIFWFGSKRHSGKRIGWGRFAEMMDRLAY